MSNREKILQYLKENGLALCDDCLSAKTQIKPRQQINQLCRNLAETGDILRYKGQCAMCKRGKIVNLFNKNISYDLGLPSSLLKSDSKRASDETHPWYWEGNIQAALVTYLAKNGYKIIAAANTAARESGKDIEAITPDGKKLWVSVKGWPEKSQNTQARHWFSQALFDIILYRDESKDVDLALAFPDGFPTYLNLAKRIGWFKDVAKFKIFWISEDGTIRIE